MSNKIVFTYRTEPVLPNWVNKNCTGFSMQVIKLHSRYAPDLYIFRHTTWYKNAFAATYR